MDLEAIKKFVQEVDEKILSSQAEAFQEPQFVLPDPKLAGNPLIPAEELEQPVAHRSSEDELFSRRLLTELDKHYHLNQGSYPSLESLSKRFKCDDLRTELKLIQPGLKGRGLPPYKFPEELDDPDELDPMFVLAVTMICNFSDKRSKEAKLKDIGLTSRQWAGFLKQKKHKAYFNERLNQVFSEDVIDDAKVAIARGVEAGDLQAVKYFHEYSGEYRPQDMQVQNLQAIIMSMMEVLAKYVTGEVLITVAEELDQRVNFSKMKELSQTRSAS